MRTVRLISGSPECRLPWRVMEPNPAVKGHPVLYGRLIGICAVRLLFSPESCVSRLVWQRIHALRSSISLIRVPCDNICLQNHLPVFDKIHMLIRKVYFRVCAAYPCSVMGCCLALKGRLPGHHFSFLYIVKKLFVLCILIHQPAVTASLHSHRISVRRGEFLWFVLRVVFFCQFLYIFFHVFLFKGYFHLLFVDLNPICNRCGIHNLRFWAKIISDLRPKIAVHLCRRLKNFLWIRYIFGKDIAVFLGQIHAVLKAVDRFRDSCHEFFCLNLCSQHFRHDIKPSVLKWRICILWGCLILLVHAFQAADRLVQLCRVILYSDFCLYLCRLQERFDPKKLLLPFRKLPYAFSRVILNPDIRTFDHFSASVRFLQRQRIIRHLFFHIIFDFTDFFQWKIHAVDFRIKHKMAVEKHRHAKICPRRQHGKDAERQQKLFA